MINDTVRDRAALSLLAGLGAFATAAVGALLVKLIKRHVDPSVPVTAALATAATVYGIDWMTERRSRSVMEGR